MKTIRYLHRRTIDEARNDKAGPLAYRKTEATEDDLLRTRSPAEILDRAERDVLSRLEKMGHNAFSIGESLAFDGPGEPPEADPDNTAHVAGQGARLAFAIRDTRRRLEDEGATPELAGIMFTLGANVEAWRALPFNAAAAGEIRREQNTEETRAANLGGTKAERRARIARAAAKVENEYQKRKATTTKNAILAEVAAPLELTGESLRKAIQRLKK